MAKCEKCYVELKCPYCDKETAEPSIPEPTQPKYELWIDVYQRNGEHDWKLLKENGVAGVCAKMGYGVSNARGASWSMTDSMFREYIAGASAAGLKTAGYWWTDPLESWSRQAETCLDMAEGLPLEFIAADMEITEGYQRVYDKKKGKYIWQKRIIAGKDIAGVNKYLIDKVIAAGYKGMLYTRKEIIVNRAPQALEWVANYPLWISSMPFEKCITCNQLEATMKRYKYCATWQEWLETYALKPDNGAWPDLPKGADWTMWQFSMDKVKLPGSQSYLDLNWRRI